MKPPRLESQRRMKCVQIVEVGHNAIRYKFERTIIDYGKHELLETLYFTLLTADVWKLGEMVMFMTTNKIPE